jgi:hypothetical protein
MLASLLLKGQLPSSSQPGGNLRRKMISTRMETVSLDSLSLVPRSVKIPGIASADYAIDEARALLTWKRRPPTDSVWVQYRVFPFKISAVAQRYRYDSIMNNFMAPQPFVFNNNSDNNTVFNFGNVTYNGSFGRAIAFGNAQDAVVSSNLNMQINGYLGDSVEIAAAITDSNIPIQPDGNTQQLNEFDRVWLQFKKKNWQLNLGDIDLRQNQNYFLSFYKRLQGASFQTENKIGAHATSKTLVSGSIAKGKFTRNIFNGEEGNQGPYRLRGANNELFFVILAGTERVFIDGELLQRGEDQDYVIDYNTAEIRFTPKRMITKDRRLQVEFEYTDRNFLNANLYLSEEFNIKSKLKFRLGMFSNSDSKNTSINQTLDDAQKQFLNTVGDNIDQAFYPVVFLDTLTSGKILYAKRDTIVGSFHDSVYVYSTNRDSAKYNLSFSDVGIGKGDYMPQFDGANGKVFKWIAPVNGVKQGRFAPVLLLITPKKLQVFSLGMDYTLSKSTTITTEVAMSNYDVNTFSRKDKNNDKGYAAKFTVKNIQRLRNGKSNPLQWQTDLGYEFTESRFRPLERLRNVEFGRDWGLSFTPEPSNEHIATAGMQLSDKKNHSLKYQFTGYFREKNYSGTGKL